MNVLHRYEDLKVLKHEDGASPPKKRLLKDNTSGGEKSVGKQERPDIITLGVGLIRAL